MISPSSFICNFQTSCTLYWIRLYQPTLSLYGCFPRFIFDMSRSPKNHLSFLNLLKDNSWMKNLSWVPTRGDTGEWEVPGVPSGTKDSGSKGTRLGVVTVDVGETLETLTPDRSKSETPVWCHGEDGINLFWHKGQLSTVNDLWVRYGRWNETYLR